MNNIITRYNELKKSTGAKDILANCIKKIDIINNDVSSAFNNKTIVISIPEDPFHDLTINVTQQNIIDAKEILYGYLSALDSDKSFASVKNEEFQLIENDLSNSLKVISTIVGDTYTNVDEMKNIEHTYQLIVKYAMYIKTNYTIAQYRQLADYVATTLNYFIAHRIMYYEAFSLESFSAFVIIRDQFFNENVLLLLKKIREIELANKPALLDELNISPLLYSDIVEYQTHFLSLYFSSAFDESPPAEEEDHKLIINDMSVQQKLYNIVYNALITYRSIVRNVILQKLSRSGHDDIINEINSKLQLPDNFITDLFSMPLADTYLFAKLSNIEAIDKEIRSIKTTIPAALELDKTRFNKLLERIKIVTTENDKPRILILDILEFMYAIMRTRKTMRNNHEYANFMHAISLVVDKICTVKHKFDQIIDYLVKKYSVQINSHTKSDIMTFLSFRADKSKINPRYRISTDESKEIVMIGYRNDLVRGSSSQTPYDQYLVGPITHVFYNKEPKDMLNQGELHSIVDIICDGRDVVVIGYGTSGSGKTSTLIYRPANSIAAYNAQGLLPLLCLGIQKARGVGTLSIELTEIDGTNEPLSNRIANFYAAREFKYSTEVNNFTLAQDLQFEGNTEELHSFSGNVTYKFNTHMTIDQYVYILLDTVRKTWPTTNNDRSSRSHMLISIKFPNLGSLVICDFAGIENEFSCDKPETIKAFSEIKFVDKPAIFAYDPVLNRYMDENYSKWIGMLSTSVGSFSDIKFDNSLQMIDASDITNLEDFRKVLDYIRVNEFKQYYAQHNNDRTSPDAEMKKYIDTIGVTDANYYIRTLFNIFNIKYGPYPSDLERLSMAIRTNPMRVDNLIKTILYSIRYSTSHNIITDECKKRNVEGAFINKSLSELRNFITRLLTTKGLKPNFIDICAPLQNNPMWAEHNTIDVTNDTGNIITDKLSAVVNIAAAQIVVFGIMNISDYGVVDPPVVPFIDTTELVLEYNRIRNLPADRRTEINADIIAKLIANITKHQKSLAEYDTLVDLANRILNGLTNVTDAVSYNIQMTELSINIESLLLMIDRARAANPLSTALFIDSMAKFGMGIGPCMIPGDGESQILEQYTMHDVSAVLMKAQHLYNKSIIS